MAVLTSYTHLFKYVSVVTRYFEDARQDCGVTFLPRNECHNFTYYQVLVEWR